MPHTQANSNRRKAIQKHHLGLGRASTFTHATALYHIAPHVRSLSLPACPPSSLIFGSFRAFTDVAPDFNPLHVARHRRRSRSRSSLSLTPVAKAKGKQQPTNRPPLCRPVRANQRRAMPPVTLALPFLSEGAAQSRQRLHCHALLPRVCMQCMYVV